MSSMKQQKGSVLIISLLLLIVSTLLGLSSMNNTVMEEKMAGNLRQQNLALQTAESSLRQGENWLSALSVFTKPVASSTGASGVWIKDAPEGVAVPTGRWWTDEATWTSDAVVYNELAGLTGYYLIEELESLQDSLNVGAQSDGQSTRDFYQITAYGLGLGGRAKAYLRTTFARRY